MNELQSIEHADKLEPLDKLSYYMEYFCNCLPDKATITFERFCSVNNILHRGPDCDDWKERGFASRTWISLNPGSIYHSVYHNLKLIK